MNTTNGTELSYFGLNCNSEIVCAYYAGIHAISAAEYSQLKKNLFGGSYIAEKQFTFPSTAFDVDCTSHKVKWDTGADIRTNSNIQVAIVEEQPLSGEYSIHLFRALAHYFNPDKYEFTQILTMKDGIYAISVAFRLIKNGVAVYHGDLTNMYP